MRELLSDDTWHQLDPYAGRLSRRDVRRVLAAVAGGVLALAAAGLVAWSGLVVPRVSEGDAGGYGYVEGSTIIYYSFEITNDGPVGVEVVGVGRDGPGLEPVPLPPVARDPDANQFGTLAPGEQMRVAVAYRVTDCDAVPAGSWPVPVRIARPWGVYSARIALPPQSHRDFDLPPDRVDGAAVSGLRDVEWQRNLADAACYHDRSGG